MPKSDDKGLEASIASKTEPTDQQEELDLSPFHSKPGLPFYSPYNIFQMMSGSSLTTYRVLDLKVLSDKLDLALEDGHVRYFISLLLEVHNSYYYPTSNKVVNYSLERCLCCINKMSRCYSELKKSPYPIDEESYQFLDMKLKSHLGIDLSYLCDYQKINANQMLVNINQDYFTLLLKTLSIKPDVQYDFPSNKNEVIGMLDSFAENYTVTESVARQAVLDGSNKIIAKIELFLKMPTQEKEKVVSRSNTGLFPRVLSPDCVADSLPLDRHADRLNQPLSHIQTKICSLRTILNNDCRTKESHRPHCSVECKDSIKDTSRKQPRHNTNHESARNNMSLFSHSEASLSPSKKGSKPKKFIL